MINKVILVGNLGADPEVRSFEDGSKVARIRIATTERIYNPVTQERRDHTEWHSVSVWRGQAAFIEQYVRKGSQVYVEGKLRSREWTDENNSKRYSIEIVADNIQLLGRRSESTGQQTSGQATQYQDNGNKQQITYNQSEQQQYSQPTQQSAQTTNFDESNEDSSDDLPF